MAGEFVDQVFVIAKHRLLSLLSNAPELGDPNRVESS